MNRILFVSICLIGIASFVLIHTEPNLEKQPKAKIVKHIDGHNLKLH